MAHELAGVTSGLRDDLAAGYAQGVAELIHAEVFSDFIGMADELQTSGYKDAAAVIAGSVLEDHLRKLAMKGGLEVEKGDGFPKKADALNAELTAADTYNGLEQKSVTALLEQSCARPLRRLQPAASRSAYTRRTRVPNPKSGMTAARAPTCLPAGALRR